MKYLICLICFFSLSINAQNTNDTVAVLSKIEVQKAKTLYAGMMQTPTYILLKNKQEAVFKSLNGLEYPLIAPSDLKKIKKI